MFLGPNLLRRAKTADLQRLARALGLQVPRRVSHEQIVQMVAAKIRRDAIADELRRMHPSR